MSDIAIHVDAVWKKFRKGEIHDSLRELIPAMAKRLVGRGPKTENLADREFWALQDVSFDVKKGESLGIIGPNGAGKSTMLKLLSRIIKPNRGSYKVNGRLSALIEVGAGFHGDLTGRENIYLNGTILGMPRKEIQRKEEQIIEFAGVKEFIETPVKRYSSGMKARLGFAVAAHMEPDVLLVDEVLSVGDAKFRQKCIRHMRSLLESNVTVVFISHLLDQVRSLCPNTVVLNGGQLIYNGPTDNAIKVYLDALGDDATVNGNDQDTDAEIRNIRLCNSEGKEVLEWTSDEPAIIECDYIVHKPLQDPRIMVTFNSIGGVYLGTANSARTDLTLPSQPSSYALRYVLDPMPLADGDYTLQFTINDPAQNKRVWDSRQPRTVTVRGCGYLGSMLKCDGKWQLIESPVVQPVSTNV